MYQSCLKSFECLLGLNSNVGIRDLAVQFSCTEAVNMASKILQRYGTWVRWNYLVLCPCPFSVFKRPK